MRGRQRGAGKCSLCNQPGHNKVTCMMRRLSSTLSAPTLIHYDVLTNSNAHSLTLTRSPYILFKHHPLHLVHNNMYSPIQQQMLAQFIPPPHGNASSPQYQNQPQYSVQQHMTPQSVIPQQFQNVVLQQSGHLHNNQQRVTIPERPSST